MRGPPHRPLRRLLYLTGGGAAVSNTAARGNSAELWQPREKYMKLRTMLGTAGLALAVTAGMVSSPAHAAPVGALKATAVTHEKVTVSGDRLTRDAESLKMKIDTFTAQVKEDTSGAGTALIDRVRKDVSSGSVAVHLPAGVEMVGSHAKSYLVKDGTRAVVVPYAGGAVVRPSALTVMFTSNGKVSSSSEVIYTATGTESGNVDVYKNGQLAKSLSIDASGARAVAPSTLSPTKPVQAKRSWWGDFKYCLSDIMFVPSWVISGISAACGVVCAITAGAGCLACALGAAGAYTTEVLYCAGWATGRA